MDQKVDSSLFIGKDQNQRSDKPAKVELGLELQALAASLRKVAGESQEWVVRELHTHRALLLVTDEKLLAQRVRLFSCVSGVPRTVIHVTLECEKRVPGGLEGLVKYCEAPMWAGVKALATCAASNPTKIPEPAKVQEQAAAIRVADRALKPGTEILESAVKRLVSAMQDDRVRESLPSLVKDAGLSASFTWIVAAVEAARKGKRVAAPVKAKLARKAHTTSNRTHAEPFGRPGIDRCPQPTEN